MKFQAVWKMDAGGGLGRGGGGVVGSVLCSLSPSIVPVTQSLHHKGLEMYTHTVGLTVMF